MSAISWLILLFDIGFAVDAGRRPASVWVAADRNKTFWVIMLALFGVLFFIPYLVGVLPQLNEAGRGAGASPFDKGSSSPYQK